MLAATFPSGSLPQNGQSYMLPNVEVLLMQPKTAVQASAAHPKNSLDVLKSMPMFSANFLHEPGPSDENAASYCIPCHAENG